MGRHIRGVAQNGPQLVAPEDPTVPTDARLGKDGGPMRASPDQYREDQDNGPQEDQAQASRRYVERSLHEAPQGPAPIVGSRLARRRASAQTTLGKSECQPAPCP